LLAELWPACFSVYGARRRPLTLGIHTHVLAACAGAIASGSDSSGDTGCSAQAQDAG
jgi:hypothetical protein